MTDAQLERYLRLLGVRRGKPTLDLLGEIVGAQLARVPFENVSKLYRLRRRGLRHVPELDEHLDGIERLHLGGTCYANNAYLHELLVTLGYRARLCGADMSQPDVHVVVVVEVERRELLVDAGFGAPFLAPMPLDRDRELVISLGRDRYLLRPRDARGRSAVELHRDGALRQGYVVRPAARDLEHFRGTIADSFRPEATFMNAFVISSFSPGRGRVLKNLSLVELRDDREERIPIADRGELVRVAEAAFGVPREVTSEALAALDGLEKDPWA